MLNTQPAPTEEVFDGRELPCETKRPGFLSRCLGLPLGGSFIFVNGHDPVPLRRQLDARYPGCFRWEITAPAEPEVVRLRVTKVALPVGGFGPDAEAIVCG